MLSFFLSAGRSMEFQSKHICANSVTPVDLLWDIFYGRNWHQKRWGNSSGIRKITNKDRVWGRTPYFPFCFLPYSMSSLLQSETTDAGNSPQVGMTNDQSDPGDTWPLAESPNTLLKIYPQMHRTEKYSCHLVIRWFEYAKTLGGYASFHCSINIVYRAGQK